jgi:glycosyltransferase involved in cell wall biosynthesis
MKVALLTTESRDFYKEYHASVPYFSTSVEALLQGFEKISDLEVHLVSCVRAHMTSPEKLAPNVFFHPLYVPKIGWMRTAYFGCIRAVRGKLREISPDIVHGQGTERECAIAAALSGYPNVVTLHGIMTEMVSVLRARPGSFYWFASLLESFSLRRTAGVFCNSRFTEEAVRARCRKTWQVPNPIREKFFVKPGSGNHPVKPLIMNVGTVCAYKRQNELLDVLEEMHRNGSQFKVQFVGAATRANAYGTRFLDRVQNSDYLSYGGFKTAAELISSFDEASALVHVSAVETFGLVVAEALARNLKFFGFKVGGVPDIAQGVEGAEIVADGDWNGLKNAIGAWAQAGAPRPVSASAAMRKKYHPEVVARRHHEIYREVLQSCSSLVKQRGDSP